jgi:hypothetical protein
MVEVTLSAVCREDAPGDLGARVLTSDHPTGCAWVGLGYPVPAVLVAGGTLGGLDRAQRGAMVVVKAGASVKTAAIVLALLDRDAGQSVVGEAFLDSVAAADDDRGVTEDSRLDRRAVVSNEGGG